MALIDLQNINKQYDIKVILKDVNFTLQESQRVAIIGQNGQGKSTLMKVITGAVQPDSGDIAIDKSIKIEMLDQHPKFTNNLIVRDAIEGQLVDLKAAKKRYDILSEKITIDFENKTLLDEYSQISSFIDHHNAWDLDNKIERILQEFSLKEFEFKNIHQLSGGEQRRVSLASLILRKPDVLLLDEPTNHLDVYMVEFLEQMLLKEKFTLLFISHDRYFIENMATHTLEIENGILRKFNGGYKNYLNQKEQLIFNMKKEHHNLIRELRREAHWMQHGISARRKRNEKRKAEYFGLKQKVKENPGRIRKMALELQREQKSFNQTKTQNKKKMLYELDNVSKKIGDKVLIKNFTTRILQKDNIAIVGKNGCGKSTILKIFLEKLKVDSGKFKKGDFKVGYFDQHREMLDDDKTIMHTFCPNGGDTIELNDGRSMHVFGYVKNFLFPKEYLDKKIGVLSGGEKNRIALALLLTKKVDILILDEPTNDLDIPTINILEEYLINFQGALIIVSHDRYFIDKIAEKLFVFTGAGNLMESFQQYTQYLEIEKEIKELNTLEKNIEKELKQKKIIQKNDQQKTKPSYKDKFEYEKLSKEIEELELKIKQLNLCMNDPDCYEKEGLVFISQTLYKTNEHYEKKVDRYLELEEIMESFNI